MNNTVETLLYIEDIARETGLEESLLRFYESEYPSLLPTKKLLGDKLVFLPAAIEAFRKTHRHHQENRLGQTDAFLDTGSRYARVIAVTSGKGGVGKSSLALNLAIELQRQGKMTVVLDADMGMANIHLLAGLQPKADLMAVLTRNLPITEVIAEGPEGIGIIPGGSGIAALADSSRHDRLRIIGALEQVERKADIIIVDTGAGMGPGVRDFLAAADELIFVLTPDLTSLADAYALLKTMHQENLANRPLFAVVNMIESLKQAADVGHRFASCARQFLDRNVENIGYLLKDSTVSASLARRTPYCVFNPQARVSRNTRTIATALLQKEQPELKLNSAFSRYRNLLKQARQGRI